MFFITKKKINQLRNNEKALIYQCFELVREKFITPQKAGSTFDSIISLGSKNMITRH